MSYPKHMIRHMSQPSPHRHHAIDYVELSARLLEQLGAPAMVELTAWVALANQFARTNFALGIEAQGFSAACGLAPLAQPSRVASQA